MNKNTIFKSALVHSIVDSIMNYSYALDYQEDYLYRFFDKYSVMQLKTINEELNIYGVETVLNKYLKY